MDPLENPQPIEHRRSARIYKQLPIDVAGTDVRYGDFLVSTRTLVLSRHGAQIVLSKALVPDQEINVHCPVTQTDVPARVVGLLPSDVEGYTYGIEFLDSEINVWRIPFAAGSPWPQADQLTPAPQASAASAKPPERKQRMQFGEVLGEPFAAAQFRKPVAVLDLQRQNRSEPAGELRSELNPPKKAQPQIAARGSGRRPRSGRRIPKQVRVWVRGTDITGKPFTQSAYSVDISKGGARLDGLAYVASAGSTIEVKRFWRKALFRIVWRGKIGSPEANEIGIQCLEPDKNIWGSSVN